MLATQRFKGMCVPGLRQQPERDTCAGHRGRKADVSSGVWQTAPELMFLESSFLPFLGSPQVHWFSRWYCLTSSNLIYFYSCLFECCISTHVRLIELSVLDAFPAEVKSSPLPGKSSVPPPPPLSILTSMADI